MRLLQLKLVALCKSRERELAQLNTELSEAQNQIVAQTQLVSEAGTRSSSVGRLRPPPAAAAGARRKANAQLADLKVPASARWPCVSRRKSVGTARSDFNEEHGLRVVAESMLDSMRDECEKKDFIIEQLSEEITQSELRAQQHQAELTLLRFEVVGIEDPSEHLETMQNLVSQLTEATSAAVDARKEANSLRNDHSLAEQNLDEAEAEVEQTAKICNQVSLSATCFVMRHRCSETCRQLHNNSLITSVVCCLSVYSFCHAVSIGIFIAQSPSLPKTVI